MNAAVRGRWLWVWAAWKQPLSYNESVYLSLFCTQPTRWWRSQTPTAMQAQTPNFDPAMLHTARFFLSSPLTRSLVAGLVAGVLWTPLAHADDYTEVNRLIRSGQPSDALNKADQYLVNKPRDPQMRFLKGVILAESGKANEAIALFTKLTEDFPELPEPYNNLAVLYAGQSQFDKARSALEMAIRTNPSYATAHENLGDVYAKLASQSYSKALQLDSTNTGVPTKLALIRNLFAPENRVTGKPVAASLTAPAPAAAPAKGITSPPPSAAAPPAAATVAAANKPTAST